MKSELNTIDPKIDASWKDFLIDNFSSETFVSLMEFIREEKKSYEIYPPDNQIFTAFNMTALNNVKVVVIGQDPYHGKGQAHGMSFSVPKGIKSPPSLKNIFKEIQSDLNLRIPEHGNLEKWAKQGVLLLNATLTVRAGEAASHQKRGWEEFTDAVITKLSKDKKNLVFLLWGRFAQAKSKLIDEKKHCILMAAHPSPFSAYNGFFGCKHFSRTNEYLTRHGYKAINWDLNN